MRYINPKSFSKRICKHYRIITTIRIHIEANQVAVGVDISIRIDESTRRRIIISALQIIQTGIGIVIISPVPERIPRSDNAPLQGRCSRNLADRAIAPSIVGVGADLDTRFGINPYNVTKNILFEIVGVKFAGVIVCGSVLQSNGRAVFVVQVNDEVIAPTLADDLGTIQGIVVREVVDDLARTDTVGVIGEGICHLPAVHGHFHELSAVPRQGVAIIVRGISDRVIGVTT